MKTSFLVEPLKFDTIPTLVNAWTEKNYKDLLEVMEYGDTSGIASDDVKEMCLLCLLDYEPEEAAKIVLSYVFKDRLNAGQLDNLSNEILNEKLWEEYADLSMHEEFFNVTQLLYEAFDGTFPHPEAVKFQVKVTPENIDDLVILTNNTEALLTRLLVQGMPENTLLNRLFKDQVNGNEFKEAKDIIWQYQKNGIDTTSIVFEIISSTYWFKDFKYAENFNTEIQVDMESV
ncbi:hypothetical protein [Aquimarina latercula]|uniref:hypothetical protein n=1 Tax=Aquimarina latercula TaxID=987 RepID=UPI0003FB8204|nr:hypothetical protein [Aquimarina latercula]